MNLPPADGLKYFIQGTVLIDYPRTADIPPDGFVARLMNREAVWRTRQERQGIMVERSRFTAGNTGPDLVAPYLEELPVTGAAISVSGGSVQETVCCSDDLARQLDELQFELGEGPRWDAASSRLPVMVPDTADAWHTRWPVFGNAVRALGVKALFVFPLVLGAIDIGVVELYRTRPGKLSGASQAVASDLTDKTSWTLLRRILSQDAAHENAFGGVDGTSLSRREIHQATGMVLAQANTNATDALLLLRGYAFSEGLPLKDVAAAVIERRLDFTPIPQIAE